jgi:predicted dehydrogenase
MAQSAAPNGKINVALVGLGAQGRVLLESLLKIGGIQLVAIADIWDYARTFGVQYLKAMGVNVRDYENHEDLLAHEKDLQAAVVATPDFWHAPITNVCLKAGLHVYCEAPMSNTVEGARSMAHAMRQGGKLLQIGYQRRSNPRYLFAVNRLLQDARVCGRITALSGQSNRAVLEDTGWPRKATMAPETLQKYGYKDMHQFRNWRWFKGLGGGPLTELGCHQIDVFNWWLGRAPQAVMASGGVDYYKTHEWYDNAVAIYEYAMPEGTVRALYEVQTTTSAGGGYFDTFMGDEATLKMSENPNLTILYREARAPSWDPWVQKGYVRSRTATPGGAGNATAVDVRETAASIQFDIPVVFSKPVHQPHLENFFDAIRGNCKLNCPADEAFASEYVVHKANEAIAAQKRLPISAEESRA